MSENVEHAPLTERELDDLRKRIDECRGRILAEFGIEWKPEGNRDADER